MDGLEWLGIADNGINMKGVRNMDLYCRMNGRDTSRLKHLDLSGVWNRDAPSMNYIFSTFKQLNRANSARSEIKELKHSPLSIVRYDTVDHPEDSGLLSDGSAPSPPLRQKFYQEQHPRHDEYRQPDRRSKGYEYSQTDYEDYKNDPPTTEYGRRYMSSAESTITSDDHSPRRYQELQHSPGQLTENYYMRRDRDKVSPSTEYKRQVHFGDSGFHEDYDGSETKLQDSYGQNVVDYRHTNGNSILNTYSNMVPSGVKSTRPVRGALFASLWD